MRLAIVAPGFVAVGFAIDTVDHAEGWKDSTAPSFVTLPLGVIVFLFLVSDRPEKKKDRKP
jgi:hypothetical protein